jgi:hypothetical protein
MRILDQHGRGWWTAHKAARFTTLSLLGHSLGSEDELKLDRAAEIVTP